MAAHRGSCQSAGLGVAALFAFANSTFALAQSAGTPDTIAKDALRLDRQAHATLTPTTTHRWTVTLERGQFAEIMITQSGADVALSVRTPSGGELRRTDEAKGGRGTEALRWLADTGGVWSVAVALVPHAHAGDYDIRLAAARAPSSDDLAALRADSLRLTARALVKQAKYGDARTALDSALAIRERGMGENHAETALLLQDLALFYYDLRRFPEAESYTRRSLAAREQIYGPDAPDVATSLNIIGLIRWTRGQYAAAESSFHRALAIRDAQHDPVDPNIGSITNNLGLLYTSLGRYAAAESAYRRAIVNFDAYFGPEHIESLRPRMSVARLLTLEGHYAPADTIFRQLLAQFEKSFAPNDPMVAWVLGAYGWNRYEAGRYDEAEAIDKRAITAWEHATPPDSGGLAAVLQNLGVLYSTLSKLSEAGTLLERALDINRRHLGPKHPDVASNLNDLGNVYLRQSRNDDAVAAYRQALDIRAGTLPQTHPFVLSTMNNIAFVYDRRGRYAEAERIYLRVVALREQTPIPDTVTWANDLNSLGLLYTHQDRFAEADSVIRRALALEEHHLGMQHPVVAGTLRNLGASLVDQHRYIEAEALYRRALTIFEALNDSARVAGTLGMIGSVYSYEHRFAEAESLFRREIEISHAAYPFTMERLARTIWLGRHDGPAALRLLDSAVQMLRDQPDANATKIEALSLRAPIRMAAHDRAGALADLGEAIRTIENWRPEIASSDVTRAEFLERHANEFDLMIRWQIESGAVERALEYAERSRARVLLDQLAMGQIDLRQSIPADVRGPLEARETDARSRIAEYQERLSRLARADQPDDARARQQAMLEDSLRRAESDFRGVYDEIKNASPLWREVITARGETVTLATMQQRLVPANGYMLFYHIADSASYLFLLPHTGKALAVPLRVTAADGGPLGVKSGALTSHVLDQLLGAETASTSSGIGVNAYLSRGPSSVSASNSNLGQARLHTLWRTLVPDSVWRRIRSASEVVVIPSRGLHALPFEALVVNAGPTATTTRYWLDDGPPIRYAASATALYDLEIRASMSSAASSGLRAVLSLSDPIFDAKDTGSIARGTFSRGGAGLSRLPGTAAETEAIRQAFGGGEAVLALQGANATESALRGALAGKRYVHLATHGLVDESRGSLFAALALTPPAKATADDDGFLQLHEIYQLRIPDVELAVLSACETNLGTSVGSEGVFALSRGFLAAGARRVIASQWSVEDRSTADLIGRFFREVAAADTHGRAANFAVALRNAKREIRRNPAWAHPYFWAAFVITGAR
jgi:tetratricopeptide (TPR) repeat protein/CHAT domain-containing protein